MISNDLLKDYLIDQEDGLKNLLTWFLNQVMQFEAMEQIDAEPYQRVILGHVAIKALNIGAISKP